MDDGGNIKTEAFKTPPGRKYKYSALRSSDWLIVRHMEETIEGVEHSLTTEEMAVVIENRKKIRDSFF